VPFSWVATSDFHVGASRRLRGYVERQESCISKIFEIAKSRTDSGVVAISADVFDREYVLPKERDMLLSMLLKGDSDGLTIIVTDGNHDRLSRTHSNLTFLKVLSRFKAFKRLRVAVIHPEKFTVDKQDFLAFPWTGLPKKQFNKVVLQAIKDFGCRKPIVMAHEQVSGCPDDTGWKTDEGLTIDNGLMKHVLFLHFGHVHKMQEIRKRVWYSGAPMQKTFGELADNKGVLIVNAKCPEEPEQVPIIGIKPMITLRRVPKKWPDAYIKLMLPKGTEFGKLPDDVVYNLYDSVDDDKPVITKVDVSDPLKDIRKLLIHVGLPKRLLNRGVDMAHDIYKRASVN
jgi:DNA repair exonuclease SbcCD nuclease subunit